MIAAAMRRSMCGLEERKAEGRSDRLAGMAAVLSIAGGDMA